MSNNEKMPIAKFAALKEANEAGVYDQHQYWRAEQPKCPHCSEVCYLSENDWSELYEEGNHRVSCPHCNNYFNVITHLSFSFSTDEQEDIPE